MDITIKSISKAYGEKTVLDGFSCVIPEHGVVCLMGESGCGKTTLLNIIMGFVQPDSGSMQGVPRNISVVFQEDRLCEDFSVGVNIAMVLAKKPTDAALNAGLTELGLAGELNTKARELSGGMKRRAALMRAVMHDSDLIILDEPFKGLDDVIKRMAMDYLLAYRAERTLIAVTHDASEAEYLGGSIIRL